jgi:CheY-like chemotaxis protein/DNA-directed RNA polymerase specialized sigma24 family protein
MVGAQMTEVADPTRMEALIGALRRYARAAVGDVGRADGCVEAALERGLAAGLPRDPTVALYRAVYRQLRRTTPVEGRANAPAEHLARNLRRIEANARHAFLLRRLEGLDAMTVAAVMDTPAATVERRVEVALGALREASHAAVLIVEDNAALAAQLAGVVAGLGHHVTAIARTADEAIAAARDRRPDVILADLDLAGERDGLAAIEAIRSDDSMAAILVSGAPEQVSNTALRRPDCILRKPFDDRVLASAVDRALATGAAGHTA